METLTVTIRLLTDMLGTVPKDKEIYKSYIESKRPIGGDDIESETVIEDMEKSGWTGFHCDGNGLFVYDYFIKGFFKHAGNVLKDNLATKALRSKLSDFFFISPRRIYFGKTEPDGFLERPLRAQTAQGPRVTLVRSDFITSGTEITFDIKLIEHKEITMKKIATILEYGQLQGLGQFRNGGYGRFEVIHIYVM